MCGIAGIMDIDGAKIPELRRYLTVMEELIAHRGPDARGCWTDSQERVGLAHRRLSIIDLTATATQPLLSNEPALAITFNGEIYNYLELRASLTGGWLFRTTSDTETILAAYARYGTKCLDHLRGMFAFALWDQTNKRLFCARDRFGIKPFYFTLIQNTLLFASEAKALLPFLPSIDTDRKALAEYLTFQYVIGENTLFSGINQLLPGQALLVENSQIKIWRYWDVVYEIDYDHTPSYFARRLADLVSDSVCLHMRSDVPVGAYLSGGIDSSLIALLGARLTLASGNLFHGRFPEHPGYDESRYAAVVAKKIDGVLHHVDIVPRDFMENIEKVIYHLDYPVGGPGSFPQFMVSKLAAQHVKVLLGGQGGDEIFGGYARYLIAYLEQCINAAIDGTYRNGNYVVTIESILPNLGYLREYKPLLQEFWRDGLFGPHDARYFRLVNRASDMEAEVSWDELDRDAVFSSFREIFNSTANVRKEAYFDSMTHFDFKCLLPALLHVEDRMSMAHGIESRVPFLDHPIVEFAATVPADVKFKGGNMKQLLKTAFHDVIPHEISARRDKMGFPVPLNEWLASDLRGQVTDIFLNLKHRHRPFINADAVLANFQDSKRFSRKNWGLINLELWYQRFHDQAPAFRKLADGFRS